MNLDITFCKKLDCPNKDCERNLARDEYWELRNKTIWIGNFENCEYWEGDKR